LSAAGSPLLVQQAKKKSGGKLQFAFNLLKSAKHEVAEDENWEVQKSREKLQKGFLRNLMIQRKRICLNRLIRIQEVGFLSKMLLKK
jgi:hypothetical protein